MLVCFHRKLAITHLYIGLGFMVAGSPLGGSSLSIGKCKTMHKKWCIKCSCIHNIILILWRPLAVTSDITIVCINVNVCVFLTVLPVLLSSFFWCVWNNCCNIHLNRCTQDKKQKIKIRSTGESLRGATSQAVDMENDA